MLSDRALDTSQPPGLTEPPPADQPAADAGGATWLRSWRGLLRWETALVFCFIATLIYGAGVPHFMSTTNIFYIGLNMGEIAIMALPLTLIIMTGEIDLSVASMLGLSSTLLGYLFKHGWPIALAMVIVLVVGAAGGALNGFLVTRLKLPSIAVTIGTLTLYRGIAEIILGTGSVTGFPLSLTKIGVVPIAHTKLAYSIGIFLVMAVIFGVVLHATPVGRSIIAIGLQSEAAHFSGIRVERIKFTLFALSGLLERVRRDPVDAAFRHIAFRCRHRPRAHGRDHRPLRRGLHLRRPGHHLRRGARRHHRRLHPGSVDPQEHLGRCAEHRHRGTPAHQRDRAQPGRRHTARSSPGPCTTPCSPAGRHRSSNSDND